MTDETETDDVISDETIETIEAIRKLAIAEGDVFTEELCNQALAQMPVG